MIGQGIAKAGQLLWAGLGCSFTKTLGAVLHNPEAVAGAVSKVPFGKWGALCASGMIRIPLAIDTVACFLQDTRRQREIFAGEGKQFVSRQAAADATWWSSMGLGALGLSAFKIPNLLEKSWVGKSKVPLKGLGVVTTLGAIYSLARRYIVKKASIDAAFDPSAGPGALCINGPMLMVDDPSSAYNGFSLFLQQSAQRRAMEDAAYGAAGSGFRSWADPYLQKFGNWLYGPGVGPAGTAGVAGAYA